LTYGKIQIEAAMATDAMSKATPATTSNPNSKSMCAQRASHMTRTEVAKTAPAINPTFWLKASRPVK
jgi:hypothetical protein